MHFYKTALIFDKKMCINIPGNINTLMLNLSKLNKSEFKPSHLSDPTLLHKSKKNVEKCLQVENVFSFIVQICKDNNK